MASEPIHVEASLYGPIVDAVDDSTRWSYSGHVKEPAMLVVDESGLIERWVTQYHQDPATVIGLRSYAARSVIIEADYKLGMAADTRRMNMQYDSLESRRARSRSKDRALGLGW